MEQRTNFIDFIKGVAIFLMLYGHSLQYGSGATFLFSGLYWENTVMKVIYSFHMPLFIAVSGYLFYFSTQRHGAIKSVKKRIITLFPICLTWGVLLWGASVVYKHTYDIRALLRLIFTDFWFLWAVMLCACVITCIDCIKNRPLKVVVSIALFIGFFITPDFYWLNAHKFMLPYFAFGYIFAKHNVFRMIKEYINYIGITCLSLWGGLALLYNKDSYIYTTGITLIGKDGAWQQLIIDVYRYMIGFTGVVVVLYLSFFLLKYLYTRKEIIITCIIKTIEFIGRNSIEYYVLSTYLYVYVVPRLTKTFELNYFIAFLETVVITLICSVGGEILKKMGLIGKLIIGK